MMLYIYYNIIYIPTISHHPSLLLSAICRSKVGHGENMLASDASAIVEHTKAGATSRGHLGQPGAIWTWGTDTMIFLNRNRQPENISFLKML